MKNWKKGKKWILIGVIVIAFAVITVVGIFGNSIPVETAVVENGEIVRLIKESGTVESGNSIIVAAKNTGEIKGVSVTEGQDVKIGDTLMTGDGTSAQLDIKSLQAQLSGLQAQQRQAKALSAKNKTLYEQGALSYEEYKQSSTIATELEAQVAALNYSIKSYAESSGGAQIIAPIEGVITGVFVKEGEMAMAGAPLFEISNLDEIYIKVDMIAYDADLVREGGQVRVYNDDTNFSDENCTVKKIHVKAQERMSDLGIIQKRVTVEIGFNSPASLRLGSDMDVEITVEKKDNVIFIPHRAIFEKDQKDYVYVVEAEKATLREVEIGIEGEDHIEIISGLSVGEEVIVSPEDEIEDGVRVKKE